MANYDTLKATIDAYIRANGVKAITGPVLNGVLRAMVDSLGNGFLFAGEALPNGDPGTPDQNVVRYATQAGTYTNYGGYVHDGKHLVWFVWHGSWNAYPTQVPTDSSLPARVSQLANDAGYITADALAAFYTKAETDALLAGKQATLESGTNIKTINGESILGSGDITIQGGGSEPYFIRGTIDFNQDPPAVTITSGTYAEALAAYNAGTPVYAALTEGNGAVNIYPLAQVISPFLVFIGIGADSVLAMGLESDGTVMVANSALVHPSDLAPVATSGDYNDLTNKPTIPGPEVFFAEYGVTTAVEVDAAVAAGKVVMCRYNGYNYRYVFTNASYVYFSAIYTERLYLLWLRRSDGNWSDPSILLEKTANKVSTLSGNESDTTKYPNTKAMADAIGKMGVIRQTQTWTQAADGGYDYTMSDLVRGLIPQANIDLFESAGAVFNASTGYFELNGLTDLSYVEMMTAYNTLQLCADFSFNGGSAFRYFNFLSPNRTIPQCKNTTTINATYAFFGSTIERLYLSITSNNIGSMFRDAKKLRTIEGPLFFSGSNATESSRAFEHCYSLENLSLSSVNTDVSFSDSPRLTAESVAHMITNAGTATITITLHATAYARATADPAVQAALAAHTNVTLASA